MNRAEFIREAVRHGSASAVTGLPVAPPHAR
jgi:hypothetical protein